MNMKLSLFLAMTAMCGVAIARDADDQIRYVGYSPFFHDLLMDMGFNFYSWGKGTVDMEKGTAEIPAAPAEREELKRLANEGAEVIVTYAVNGNAYLQKTYPRVDRAGKPLTRQKTPAKAVQILDPALPNCAAAIANGARALGKAYADLGPTALVGFRGLEEVRLSSRPSFSSENNAQYRAYAGVDIPAEAKGRSAPNWKKISDFPADRIVDEDYPLLKYYRWFWQKGDGWASANDAASEAFKAGFGRDVVSLYAPVLRMPHLWGIGGNSTHLLEWIYLTPHPFNIRYQIAEMQASARGNGAAIVPTVDGIIRTGGILPKRRNPDPLPEWFRYRQDAEFVTIPPDWAREAFWLMCSRRSDGIGLSVAPGVLGVGYGESYWCEKTNNDTVDAIREVMKSLAVPLGPLLRNMPERAPEVAILESYATALLATDGPWDWRTTVRSFGELVALANLDQYAIFEEEIARDGIPPSVKAILLPDCPVLTRTTAEKLREFQSRGGRLIASETLAPGLKADAILPDFKNELPILSNGRGECEPRDRAMRAKAAEIKATLCFPLFAETDNDAILLSVRSYGSADVVFAVNDKRTYGDYIGPWKMAFDKGCPNRADITLRRSAGAVYDLVRHQAVPFSCEGGVTHIPVAYETCDGKALLVSERPLAPLSVIVTNGILTVSSADGDVMVPFGVYAASGRLIVAGILRDGNWSRPLPPDSCAVVNFATGERTPLRRRLEIGMSGFSKAVCNEKGVQRLKAIGADFASGVKFDDEATLDLFLKYGLRADVAGLPGWWGGGKKNTPGSMAEKRPVAAFEKALENFKPHPAMRAITVGDEPSSLDFEHFEKVTAAVARRCGGVPPSTPLFPEYGSLISIGDEAAKAMLGTDSYAAYVNQWCEKVPSSSSVCIDFYPYSAPKETRHSYFLRRFHTLAVGATAAKKSGKPYSLYVQANSLDPALEMTLPHLRYQAWTALAHGACSLRFTCYTPSWWTNNILTATGEPTSRYYAVQALIGQLRNFESVYMRYDWVGVRYVGFSSDELAVIGGSDLPQGYDTPYGKFVFPEGVKFVVGDFVARFDPSVHAVLIARADNPDCVEGVETRRIGVVARNRPLAYAHRRTRVMPVRDSKTNSYSYPVASDGFIFVTESCPELLNN